MGSIKRFDISTIARNFDTEYFVETGTWRGDGLAYAAKFSFLKLYSIEIMPEIADQARERFINDKRVEIFTGNSPSIFPELLAKIKGNILFWLDAHYPGAEEGLKNYNEHDLETERLPLEKELELIKELRSDHKDLIVIDDLRIYEHGPFESGNLPGNIDNSQNADLRFIDRLYGESHHIKKFYSNEGYIVLEPKSDKPIKLGLPGLFNRKFRHKIY